MWNGKRRRGAVISLAGVGIRRFWVEEGIDAGHERIKLYITNTYGPVSLAMHMFSSKCIGDLIQVSILSGW